jgi:hypothetical protein
MLERFLFLLVALAPSTIYAGAPPDCPLEELAVSGHAPRVFASRSVDEVVERIFPRTEQPDWLLGFMRQQRKVPVVAIAASDPLFDTFDSLYKAFLKRGIPEGLRFFLSGAGQKVAKSFPEDLKKGRRSPADLLFFHEFLWNFSRGERPFPDEIKFVLKAYTGQTIACFRFRPMDASPAP